MATASFPVQANDPLHPETHNDIQTRLLALEARTSVLVLAVAAPVPGGTPAGTVILRTP
jgi:hypothetical protein